MDINEWNDKLFQSLVVENGRPGDPLYLYIDDEMLAEIGGFQTIEEALEDFKEAFKTTSFRRLARSAHFWRMGGFKGTPPFICGLAITVLAATLPTLGMRTSNVYARQRDLLGLSDLESGAPEGYVEYVPLLWKIWNDWLDNQGAQHGLKTAHEHPHFVNQGWARSQSFIRAKDKEIIYSFFKSRESFFEQDADGEELVRLLRVWLRGKGIRTRLSVVAEDKTYHDELAQCLLASLKFWKQSIKISSVKHNLPMVNLEAVPYWESQTDELSLIVLNSPEFAGKLFRDLGGEEYQVEQHDTFLYLTPEDMTPTSWLNGQPIEVTAIGETRVTWDPNRVEQIIFEQSNFDGWIRASEVRHGKNYRVLLLENYEEFESGFDTVPGPQEIGFWLRFNGKTLIPGEKISVEAPPKIRDVNIPFTARLSGGLKVAQGNTYLVRGEPDILIDGLSSIHEMQINIDNQPFHLSRLSFQNGKYLLRTRALRLSASEHRVEMRIGSSLRKLTFQTVNPRMLLGDQLGHELIQPSPLEIAPRVHNRAGASILLFDEKGNIWKGKASQGRTKWLEELNSNPQDIPFERMIDLNTLSFNSGKTLAALRRTSNSKWKVMNLNAAPIDIGKALRVNLVPTTVAAPEVLDFLYGKRLVFSDDGQTEKLQRTVRTALGQSLNGQHTNKQNAYLLPVEDDNMPETRSDINSNWGISEMNPLDDFLYWLSELPKGSTLASAQKTWEWLHLVHQNTPLEFQGSLRALQSLGHVSVERAKSRIFASPTQIVLLPASEGIGVLVGARNRNFCNELRTPSESLPEAVEDAIMNIAHYEFAQTLNKSMVAPTTIMLQLGSEDIIQQSTTLNAQLVPDLPLRLLKELEPIETSIKKTENEFLPSGQIVLDMFVPGKTTPGGTWHRIDQFPDKEAFLRITNKRSKKYAWWDYQHQKIYESGWVKGLWLFHAKFTTMRLIGRIHSRSQMVVTERVPLPPEFERALVARSGLLPRQAFNGDEGWKVYENVPPEVVLLIKEYLGQEQADMVRPTRLEFV